MSAMNLTSPLPVRQPNHFPEIKLVDPPAPSASGTTTQPAYGKFLHGIASDIRLSAVERLVCMALLHWAWAPSDRCNVADWRLADYLDVSEPTIRRSLAKLERLGLIRREAAPYTAINMTGRSIVLLWISNPSCVPVPPSHHASKGETRPFDPCNHRSPMIDPRKTIDTEQKAIIDHGRSGGALTGDREGRSPVSAKEASLKEERKKGQTTDVFAGECVDARESGQSGQSSSPRESLQEEKRSPDTIKATETVTSVACLTPGPSAPTDPKPLKVMPEPVEPPPLASILDQVMAKLKASPPPVEPPVSAEPIAPAEPVEPSETIKPDPARAALIDKINEIAPGPDNRGVRQAILNAVPDLFKKVKLAGSVSPFDHIRMALEKAAANPKRRDSIESLARGILRNWIEEGFPATNAPEPPGRSKFHQVPDVSPVAAAYHAEAKAADASNVELKARWLELPESDRARIKLAVEQANPGQIRFKLVIQSLCHDMMIKECV